MLTASNEVQQSAHRIKDNSTESEATLQVNAAKLEKDEAFRQLCEEKDEAFHRIRDVEREKREAMYQLREAMREKDEAVARLEEVKREKDKANRQCQEAQCEKDEAIGQLQRAKTLKAEELREAKREKDEAIRQLHEKDSKFLEKIQGKSQEIRGLEEEIRQLILSSKDYHRQLVASQEEVENKNGKITAMEEETRRLQASLNASQEQVHSKTRRIEVLQHQLGVQDQFRIPDTSWSWKVSRSEIQAIPRRKEIGRGAWGEVYSAIFRGKDVAIKIVHEEIFHVFTIDLIKREIMIMSHVQHPNLVRFIAAVWDEAVEEKKEAPIIVSELMDMNLRKAYRARDLSSSLISIFCDVAYALHYLHCQGIIHRDISAPNVLLKYSSNRSILAKVSDFGSANMAKQSKTVGAGAVLYSAPEMFASITSSQKQTPKVDVYSYGVLLLEVTSREMPSRDSYKGMLQLLATQMPDIHKLIVQCTEHSPTNRPTMCDILSILNRLC